MQTRWKISAVSLGLLVSLGTAFSVAAVPETQPAVDQITAGDGKYQITIDTSDSPELTQWADTELAPVVEKWYPKIVAELPSDGYQAPTKFKITFREKMNGVAYTGGTNVVCAAGWFKHNFQGEARGAVVHELVHVVQQYRRPRQRVAGTQRNPGWLVEGMADYIRWFQYEPQSHGAEVHNSSRAKYDASYRVTANFLNWVTEKYNKKLVPELNAAMRENAYNEDLWKKLTGKTVQELGEEWKASLPKRG